MGRSRIRPSSVKGRVILWDEFSYGASSLIDRICFEANSPVFGEFPPKVDVSG